MSKFKIIEKCEICKTYEAELIVETSIKGKVIATENLCASCFQEINELEK